MNTKTLITSKTFWAGLSTIALGIGAFLSGEKELQELVIIVVGIIFTYLRLITNTEIKGIK